eukprot:jgi/Chlat1/2133/Chrsp17S02718
MASAASASLLRVVTLPSSCSPSPSPSSLRSRHNAAAAAPKLQRGLCTVSCSANSSSSTGVAVRKAAAAAVAAAGALMVTAHPAFAVEKVAEFAGSGLIFRDSIEVVSIEDPKASVEGVTIYLSDFKRNLMDKLSKDFFNEPSQASLSCAQTGPMHVTGNLRGGDGEEVYEDNKNFMNFKSIHVRRVFDKKHNALVYVTYSTRFGDDPNNKSIGKYKSSVCVVPFYSPTLASFGNEATKEAPALR